MGRGRRRSGSEPDKPAAAAPAPIDDDGFGPPLGAEAAPLRVGAPPQPEAGDDFGPAVKGRRRAVPPLPGAPRLPRPGRRGLKLVLVVLLVLALAAVGTVTTMAAYATLSMRRVEVTGLAPMRNGVMNVLVVGSDSREGLTPEELLALGTEAVDSQRTDSIFLLSVRGGAAAVLSFPRDLFVTRCDGSQGRINSAFSGSGGASCLVTTVAQVSGIPVTHYLEVDFAGFVEMVDAVGGVPVYLEQPMTDRFAGVDLPQGCNMLDGRQALGFVRARTIDSDLGRIARQQRFISQLAKSVARPSTLVNPLRLFQVTRAGAGALAADEGLGIVDLFRLARAGRGLAAGGLASYTVPTEAANIGGADVLVPTEEAEALYQRFRDSSVLEVAAGADVAPADFVVDVYNGARIEGVAARGRDVLTERGFRVGQVGNAAAEVERTVVRHAPRAERAAQLVAAQFPGVGTEAVQEGESQVALVMGPDAPGLLAAPPPAAPPPPPPAAGQPAPAPPAVAAPAVPLGAGVVPEDCG